MHSYSSKIYKPDIVDNDELEEDKTEDLRGSFKRSATVKFNN